MNDQTPMGHNNGPAFNPDVVDEFTRSAEQVAEAAAQWKEAGAVETEEKAQLLNDFLTSARGLHKQVDDRRKAEKQPHLDAGREVDAAFNQVKDVIERAAKMVKPLLEDYLRKKEAAERARREEESRKAREEQEAAERLVRQADERNDAVGAQKAEDAQKAAAKALAEAEKNKSAKVSSGTGIGKATSLRVKRFAELVNVNQAMLHYRNHPDLQALLLRLANADVRAAKGASIELPGFVIKEERAL